MKNYQESARKLFAHHKKSALTVFAASAAATLEGIARGTTHFEVIETKVTAQNLLRHTARQVGTHNERLAQFASGNNSSIFEAPHNAAEAQFAQEEYEFALHPDRHDPKAKPQTITGYQTYGQFDSQANIFFDQDSWRINPTGRTVTAAGNAQQAIGQELYPNEEMKPAHVSNTATVAHLADAPARDIPTSELARFFRSTATGFRPATAPPLIHHAMDAKPECKKAVAYFAQAKGNPDQEAREIDASLRQIAAECKVQLDPQSARIVVSSMREAIGPEPRIRTEGSFVDLLQWMIILGLSAAGLARTKKKF